MNFGVVEKFVNDEIKELISKTKDLGSIIYDFTFADGINKRLGKFIFNWNTWKPHGILTWNNIEKENLVEWAYRLLSVFHIWQYHQLTKCLVESKFNIKIQEWSQPSLTEICGRRICSWKNEAMEDTIWKRWSIFRFKLLSLSY